MVMKDIRSLRYGGCRRHLCRLLGSVVLSRVTVTSYILVVLRHTMQTVSSVISLPDTTVAHLDFPCFATLAALGRCQWMSLKPDRPIVLCVSSCGQDAEAYCLSRGLLRLLYSSLL